MWAGRGIERPQDLRGKRLAAPAGDAGRTLFPAFARANGLSPSDVTWITVAPPIREPMLYRGEADAITAFVSSAHFVLQNLGVRADGIRMFRYNDHSVGIYGTGHVDAARAQTMVTLVAEAFGVPKPPSPESFMRTEFLPPRAERMLPAFRS